MHLQSSLDIRRVMDLYTPLIYRLAYLRTGNHSDAEDICQEVFLALVRKNPDFENEENRRAWLIRVCINRTNSLWRTAWHKHVTLDNDFQHFSLPSSSCERLSDALMALAAEDRTLLQLYYFEGFKTEEIASILGRKPATIRTQLLRARKRLKVQLTEEV